MQKLKVLLLSLCFTVISACSLQIPVDVASGLILTSDSVDSMQAELGEYSVNQDVLVGLDTLQADIQKTITTGDGVGDIEEYYSKALVIYAVLKTEIVARKDELTEAQIAKLQALDAELVALNTSILLFKETVVDTAVSNIEVLQTLQRAMIILSYVKGI